MPLWHVLRRQVTTELDKKQLSATLWQALIHPALQGFVADKPGLVVQHASVTVTIEGEVVDAEQPVRAFENADGPTHVIVLLPPDVHAAAAKLRQVLAREERAGGGSSGAANAGGGSRSSIATGQRFDQDGAYPFHVNIHTVMAPTDRTADHYGYETETRLNSVWLDKPLRTALVEPAMRNYYRSAINAPQARARHRHGDCRHSRRHAYACRYAHHMPQSTSCCRRSTPGTTFAPPTPTPAPPPQRPPCVGPHALHIRYLSLGRAPRRALLAEARTPMSLHAQVALESIKLKVDGRVVDGWEPASAHTKPDGSPVVVDLTLPQAMDVRRSSSVIADAVSSVIGVNLQPRVPENAVSLQVLRKGRRF